MHSTGRIERATQPAAAQSHRAPHATTHQRPGRLRRSPRHRQRLRWRSVWSSSKAASAVSDDAAAQQESSASCADNSLEHVTQAISALHGSLTIRRVSRTLRVSAEADLRSSGRCARLSTLARRFSGSALAAAAAHTRRALTLLRGDVGSGARSQALRWTATKVDRSARGTFLGARLRSCAAASGCYGELGLL